MQFWAIRSQFWFLLRRFLQGSHLSVPLRTTALPPPAPDNFRDIKGIPEYFTIKVSTDHCYFYCNSFSLRDWFWNLNTVNILIFYLLTCYQLIMIGTPTVQFQRHFLGKALKNHEAGFQTNIMIIQKKYCESFIFNELTGISR